MKLNFTTIPPEGNPFAELERVRAQGPIFWSDTLHGWVVSGYDNVKKVLKEMLDHNNYLVVAMQSEEFSVETLDIDRVRRMSTISACPLNRRDEKDFLNHYIPEVMLRDMGPRMGR